jgi:hypothetical protein
MQGSAFKSRLGNEKKIVCLFSAPILAPCLGRESSATFAEPPFDSRLGHERKPLSRDSIGYATTRGDKWRLSNAFL